MKKTSGSVRIPRFDVVIVEEATCISVHALTVILTTAHSNDAHVIATYYLLLYDVHHLQPVVEDSGMSISRDDIGRAKVLKDAFPTCFHVLARKRE